MRLYGSDLSPFVMRVVMLAKAKGLSLERAEPPGGPKGTDYLAINPIGKVPALVDDDVTLAESEVICEYLEDKIPQPTLRPATPDACARARLIARVADFYVFEPFVPLFSNLGRRNRDQAVVDAALLKVTSGLGYLETFLSDEGFAAGPQRSGADCALIPILFYVMRFLPMFDIADPLADHSKLETYWGKMQSQPDAAEALSAMDAALSAATRAPA